MRQIILSMAVLAMVSFTSCKDNAKKDATTTVEEIEEVVKKNDIAMTEATFGVRGNCGMCESTIEKAVKDLDGISKADWDKDKKKIAVAFDDSKTNVDAIHNAIAASGYDTEKVAANEEAYSNLPECCQYDHEMEMSQE